MCDAMSDRVEDLEVLAPVVSLVAVAVVDLLIAAQRPPEHLGRDEPMLELVLPDPDLDGDVSIAADIPRACDALAA